MSKATPGNPSQEYFDTEHLTAALGSRTARGGVVTIVSHGLKFALSILATAVLARLLTPQDYGLIGMVAVFTGFVAMFKDLGPTSRDKLRPDKHALLGKRHAQCGDHAPHGFAGAVDRMVLW